LIGSKISRRYAKALLSLGQEDGQYELYGQNLNEFADFCSANKEFFQIISSQIFSLEDRQKILEAVLEKSSFTELLKNFLRLLLDKSRMRAVRQIAEYYTVLTDEISNITRAQIVTAKPLKKDALERLEKALEEMTSKDVRAEVKEDESLIGGVVVRIGDLVLDGSVRAQLEGLKESLRRGEYS